VPPFDHPLIWSGNSTLIDEIKEQLGDIVPDCVVASIGGGGLMCGIIEGLIRHRWIETDMKIIAVETEGADCFNQSIKQNELVTLDSISRHLY
jgi:L-serine/L-threonine ammonia-lyase